MKKVSERGNRSQQGHRRFPCGTTLRSRKYKDHQKGQTDNAEAQINSNEEVTVLEIFTSDLNAKESDEAFTETYNKLVNHRRSSGEKYRCVIIYLVTLDLKVSYPNLSGDWGLAQTL